jgi:hypothetical protein
VLAIDDPALLRQLAERDGDGHSLTLLRSERSMTDCRPISLFSLQTVQQLGEEVGAVLDKRRFRANMYLDLGAANGFSENGLVGRKVQIIGSLLQLTRRDDRKWLKASGWAASARQWCPRQFRQQHRPHGDADRVPQRSRRMSPVKRWRRPQRGEGDRVLGSPSRNKKKSPRWW